jgi:hypothetical protein
LTSLMRFIARFLRLATAPLRAIGDVMWTLAVPTFRALAGVMLVIAAVALASDLGPLTSAGAKNFHPTTVINHWQQTAPASLESTRTFFTKRTKPWIWDALSTGLRLPTFVFFVGCGLAFGYLGRRRTSVEIFIN